jgi:RNA polymerase sigma factor (sigma-70 family)
MSEKKSSKKTAPKEVTFESCLDMINVEIAKRRCKWQLDSISWMDYDDVSQILRFHIYKKWHLFDQTKNPKPWVRTIITNQIKNLVRNNYSNFVKPCNRCEAAMGEKGCTIYGEQGTDCPLYKNWNKNKKSGLQTKFAISLENHAQETFYIANNQTLDIEISSRNLHKRMEEVLKPHEWMIYKYLYIDNLSELEVAKKMGYKTSEKNRSPGYKQIKNVKKRIIARARKAIEDDEIDIY